MHRQIIVTLQYDGAVPGDADAGVASAGDGEGSVGSSKTRGALVCDSFEEIIFEGQLCYQVSIEKLKTRKRLLHVVNGLHQEAMVLSSMGIKMVVMQESLLLV